MFADDTRIMSSISDESDLEEMQKDLDTVHGWAGNNNMQFNCGKFELIRYGKDEAIKNNTFYIS